MCSSVMEDWFFWKFSREKLSHTLPAALIRFRSESTPFEIAPMPANESDRMVVEIPTGIALIIQERAAISGRKLFQSERIIIPPCHIILCCKSVMTILRPEFALPVLRFVETSV